MLCFSMRPGEYFTVDDSTVIQMEKVAGDRVHLIVNAPREVRILRGAVLERQGGERPGCVVEIPPQPTRQLPWNSAKRRALAELRQLLDAQEDSPEAQAMREKLDRLFPRNWDGGRETGNAAAGAHLVSTG